MKRRKINYMGVEEQEGQENPTLPQKSWVQQIHL